MLAMSQVLVVFALAGGLMATLQGCAGGDSAAPTPAPPPPGPPVWKWTKGNPKCKFDDPTGNSCTQVGDKQEMAQSLTNSFQAFDPAKPDGKELGVYMTMQTNDLHIYCEGKCYKGHADCILSVAIYNSHMMLDGDQQGAHLNSFAGMTAGYVLNTDKVESRYAKCAYMFDGAINSKLYWGCGNAAEGGADCDNPKSAFHNMCKGPDGKPRTCTADDVEVRPRNDCTIVSNKSNPYYRPFPVRTDDTPCFWTGPAFRFPDYTKAAEDNQIKQMVINRINNENPSPGDCSDVTDQCKDPKTGAYYPPIGPAGFCCKPYKDGKPQPGCEAGEHKIHQTNCNRMAKWNEIAIDLRPMKEDLERDPNGVIVAFVYSDASGKIVAEKLRQEFKDKYGGPGDVPLIFLDLNQNVIKTLKKSGSPFKAEMPGRSIEHEEQAISV
jgi:hypothetical protein